MDLNTFGASIIAEDLAVILKDKKYRKIRSRVSKILDTFNTGIIKCNHMQTHDNHNDSYMSYMAHLMFDNAMKRTEFISDEYISGLCKGLIKHNWRLFIRKHKCMRNNIDN